MHVAVEATRLLREQRGIGRYVWAMLPRMAAERGDVSYTLYSKGRDVSALSDMLASVPALASRCDVQSVRRMRGATADVHWFPWNVVRPIPRTGPIVVTVHDAVPIALTPPGWRTWRKRRRWWGLYRDTVKYASIMLADSRFTADEIVRLLQAPRHRIRVVHLGADDHRASEAPDDATAAPAALLAALGITHPYLLAVGADEPRKNFGVLYRALDRLAVTRPQLRLVRVGPQAHKVRDFSTGAKWMHRLGFITNAELSAVYGGAAAFICPSTYEGFGLPVLEAMQAGAPVICADASSLSEVAGSAALYFAPADEDGLIAAIEQLLGDSTRRNALVAAGKMRAAEFRWRNTALATLAAFDEACAAGRVA